MKMCSSYFELQLKVLMSPLPFSYSGEMSVLSTHHSISIRISSPVLEDVMTLTPAYGDTDVALLVEKQM